MNEIDYRHAQWLNIRECPRVPNFSILLIPVIRYSQAEIVLYE